MDGPVFTRWRLDCSWECVPSLVEGRERLLGKIDTCTQPALVVAVGFVGLLPLLLLLPWRAYFVLSDIFSFPAFWWQQRSVIVFWSVSCPVIMNWCSAVSHETMNGSVFVMSKATAFSAHWWDVRLSVKATVFLRDLFDEGDERICHMESK
jgi:hypothetical protein